MQGTLESTHFVKKRNLKNCWGGAFRRHVVEPRQIEGKTTSTGENIEQSRRNKLDFCISRAKGKEVGKRSMENKLIDYTNTSLVAPSGRVTVQLKKRTGDGQDAGKRKERLF